MEHQQGPMRLEISKYANPAAFQSLLLEGGNRVLLNVLQNISKLVIKSNSPLNE